MINSLKELFDGVNLNEVEIEDQGFFLDNYEVECYWDVKEWNAERTDYSGHIIWEGSTINPFDHTDEDGYMIRSDFATAIRRQIELGLDDENRVGPVYVVC